ncbi:hypothetical protein MCEMIEM13_01506 [Comamonadaceae bacterium]
MHNVAETSIHAHSQIGMRKRKAQLDVVFDIVLGACRNGAPDMSLREIAAAFHRLHGKPIDVGTVSGRVTQLVAAERLVRVEGAERLCTLSGKTVHPVTVPAKQARLCA